MFMANTVHITVRLPVEVVKRVDAEAARLQRSRSWVIAWILSDAELYHKDKSATIAQPAEHLPRKQTVSGSIPDGRSKQCSDCGGMNGMHQKWCKGGKG